MISIRSAIADALYSRENYRYPSAKDIVSVEFLKGCDEIRVTYELSESEKWSDEALGDTVIDAEPVLTAMLQQMVDEDTGHIPLEDQ